MQRKTLSVPLCDRFVNVSVHLSEQTIIIMLSDIFILPIKYMTDI